MGKIVYLENARNSALVFLVYLKDGEYHAINATNLSVKEVEAKLPLPIPNYIKQAASTPKEAIKLVKDSQLETLLSSPL